MTKNRFEEISQYIHFSDSTQESQRGDDDYDHLFKVRRIMNMGLSNFQRIKKKWYKYIFWFLSNVSVCNAFVLESEHVGSKRESVYFKLDLTQQLIDGFLQ